MLLTSEPSLQSQETCLFRSLKSSAVITYSWGDAFNPGSWTTHCWLLHKATTGNHGGSDNAYMKAFQYVIFFDQRYLLGNKMSVKKEFYPN